jgi:dolichyl-phosphate-mannose-protein mannosyltransferase
VSFTPGYRGDILDFSSWAHVLATAGPLAIYGSDVVPKVDYPPAYLFVLWAIGALHGALGGGELGWRLLLKIPPMCADLVCVALLHAFVRRHASERRAWIVAAVAAFAPLLWFDSAYWGQIDSIPIAFALAAVFCATEEFGFAGWLLLALGILIKPQVIVVAPVLAVLAAHRAKAAPFTALRDIFAALLSAGALAYLETLPFTASRAPADVFGFLFSRYALGLEKAPEASEGAFNLYTIAGPFFRSDAATFAGLSLRVWGIALSLGAIALVTVAFSRALRAGAGAARRDAASLAAAALCALALFLFATRMHERYLLPAIVFALPFAFDDVPAAATVGWLTLSFVIDCSFVISGFHGGAHHPVTVLVAHAVSLLNVLAFGLLADRFRRRFARRG